MQDVIFSGTENRKPLSFASVSITLDNSDHKLPVDYNEVTVARRLYRSGESEYLINGSGCRLKDIQEMLGKAGIPVPLARLKALLAQKEDGLAHKSDTTPEEKDTAPAAKKEHAFTTGGTSQEVPL